MDQLDGLAGRTSWTDQLFFSEDFPFSLYIVAASESDEGLVYLVGIYLNFSNVFLPHLFGGSFRIFYILEKRAPISPFLRIF